MDADCGWHSLFGEPLGKALSNSGGVLPDIILMTSCLT